MDGNHGPPSVGMKEASVAAFLVNLFESRRFKRGDERAAGSDGNPVGADKFRVVRGPIVVDVLKDEFDGLLHAFA